MVCGIAAGACAMSVRWPHGLAYYAPSEWARKNRGEN